MHFYIAGPMTGRPQFNFPEFDRARDHLLALGHTVTSPADEDRKRGFDACTIPPTASTREWPASFSRLQSVYDNVTGVEGADALCFIDSKWMESYGSVLELAAARVFCKPVYEFFDEDSMPRRVFPSLVAV